MAGLLVEIGRYDLLKNLLINVNEEVIILFEKNLDSIDKSLKSN